MAFDYGGSTKNSNLKIVQSFQSINLYLLTNAPWYVSNRSLHHDLNVPRILLLALYNYNKFHKSVLNHSNPLIANLASTTVLHCLTTLPVASNENVHVILSLMLTKLSSYWK